MMRSTNLLTYLLPC